MTFTKFTLTSLFSLYFSIAFAQKLNLKPRSANAMGGKEFALLLSDTSLSLEKREEIIFKEIKNGNVPQFLRKLKAIDDTITFAQKPITIRFFVWSDYLSVGSNDDFFYVPMTPILAQRIATLTKSILPTKKLVDLIYQNATIKLRPQPIAPSKAMTTLPVFVAHNDSVTTQLKPYIDSHNSGNLTAGNKKDIIISPKIYSETTAKVVIYGWHQLNGKAIQPVYNKHTNLWADYSHGVRLVQQLVLVNGKKQKIENLLKNPATAVYFSDEGVIAKPFYPVLGY